MSGENFSILENQLIIIIIIWGHWGLVNINFHVSVLLTITIFFTIPTFIFENRLFFADFFQFVKRCMLLVRHDKHVNKINFSTFCSHISNYDSKMLKFVVTFLILQSEMDF